MSDKNVIGQLFVQKKCILNEFGMKFPNEAYFQMVNLFSDLPIIKFQKPLSVQNVMQLFGVRKVVELRLIFERLVGNNDYDHMRLVKYLASESKNLNDEEKVMLKYTPIWLKEGNEDTRDSNSEIQRFVISDLHVPNALFRELGLPIIDWKRKWSHNAPEGKFLIELGLREFPKLKTILELAASSSIDQEIREKALKYFIDNFDEKYLGEYYVFEVNVAFLPSIRQDIQFKVTHLGVRPYPNDKELKKRLIEDPPQDVYKAKEIFEFLALQPACSNWYSLKDHNFIPIRDKLRPDEYKSAYLCFLNNFFTFIDFGEKANNLLKNMGVRIKPLSVEIVELLVKSSREVWNSMGNNYENYLEILSGIASDYRKILKQSVLIEKMKNTPILATIKNVGEGDDLEYSLNSANNIFINDDTAYQKIFNTLTASDNDALKILYKNLGCRSLSESVTEITNTIGISQENMHSQLIEKTIMYRAHLFYNGRKDVKNGREIEWLKKLKVRRIDQVMDYLAINVLPKSIPLATPENLRNALRNYINADQSNSSEISHGYCVDIPDHLLREVVTLKGIKVYNTQSSNLLQTHNVSLTCFVEILKRLTEVFQIKIEDVHVYYDDDSSKIAFYRDKGLYFNFKTHLELYEEECNSGILKNAMYYWFVSACHELAHNVSSNHDSTHERNWAHSFTQSQEDNPTKRHHQDLGHDNVFTVLH
ncbi:12630_t:CDS:2 [Funneliformis geosporum]|nr:12630_t:CDS:2 [Funneliformis geosporum]